MKNEIRFGALLFAIILSNFANAQNWILGSFTKTKENPIVKADSSYKFFDPIKKDSVRWQKADVFNPAAVVKDRKIYLFTRCEDNPAVGIGERTSRIGLCESSDGIHFTKYPYPVLFPDSDEFLQCVQQSNQIGTFFDKLIYQMGNLKELVIVLHGSV